MATQYEHEFGFELRVCAWAERSWPPDETTTTPVIVARQLGTASRRWDTVVVEVDPEATERRLAFGDRRLDGDLLHVVRNAPSEWTYYREALPDPGYPWRYVREAVHRAADRGAIRERKVGNRIEIERRGPYPDWVERVIAIENKPDLDASAASALADQIERDVAHGLADEVWIATGRTGDRVEPALLEDVPVEAGILTVEDGDADVLWYPRSLDVEGTGTVIRERGERSEYGETVARFEYVDPETKTDTRLEIAERAFERGWRSYLETMRPDCRHFDVRRASHGYVPACRAKEREQTGAECRGSCESFEPEPPAWRQRGWPIEGGPGKAVRRVLESRQDRNR
ncbi:MAG: DUF5787 family protein [Halanaeroarchaeum sp.]